MPILFLVFILVGCGSIDEKKSKNNLQADDPYEYGKFEMFVDNFKALAEQHGIDLAKTDLSKLKRIITYDREIEISMEFPRSQLGICLTRDTYNQILLKDTFTEKSDFPTLKWILFHELGHCVLGLEHSKDQNSLMFYRTPYLSLSNEMVDDAINAMFIEYKNKPKKIEQIEIR